METTTMNARYATIYTTATGTRVPASATDQAGRRGASQCVRTWNGRAVVECGDSYTIERQYQARAITRAELTAREIESFGVTSWPPPVEVAGPLADRLIEIDGSPAVVAELRRLVTPEVVAAEQAERRAESERVETARQLAARQLANARRKERRKRNNKKVPA